MNLLIKRLLWVASFAALMGNAFAQPVFKCGNAYSETPCADGKPIAAQDLRTEAQKSQADETTIRQKTAASGFEKERIAQEKRDAKALKDAGPAVILGRPEKSNKASAVNPNKRPKTLKPAKPVKAAEAAKAAEASKKTNNPAQKKK